MAVPRNRHSNSRKNKKRAHDAKSPANAVACANCGKKHLPHRVCPHCGHYAGKNWVNAEQE